MSDLIRLRSALRATDPRPAGGTQLLRRLHLIKQTVHLAMQGQERADLLTAPAGDGRLFAAPGDQITKSHDVLHSPVSDMHLHSRGRRPAGCVSFSSGYAALA